MTCPAPYSVIDGWSLHVQQPDAADFCLMFSAPYGGRIASVAVKSGVGSGHFSVKINGVAVGGLSNAVFNTLKKQYAAQDHNEFPSGAQIVFAMLDGVNVADLRVTVTYAR